MNRRDSKKVTIDNIAFDSDKEGRYYADVLKPLSRAGKITQLQCHPKFTFIVNGVRIGTMKPDFTFVDEESRLRCQDVKGWKKSKLTGKMLPRLNRESGLKKKLMLALFSIDVEYV